MTSQMTDLRNFRSSYLEKVGIKGIEEKKSLEFLLKEQPVDLSRLSQFCIRFPVPAAYRLHLWKLLLGNSVGTLIITINIYLGDTVYFVYSRGYPTNKATLLLRGI